MVVILSHACDLFAQFAFPLFSNHAIAVLHGKNCLNVNLGVGVCHNGLYCATDGTFMCIG
jgi:hypothetical protein